MDKKINFTQEHFQRLQQLATAMLFSNGTIRGKLGTPLNIMELLHETTINALKDILKAINSKIERLEVADEWVSTDSEQEALQEAKIQKELVNLIIGYKRYIQWKEESSLKLKELKAKRAEIIESQKTPDDQIKDLDSEIAEIEGAM